MQTDVESTIENAVNNSFIGTARGTYLDNLAGDRGIVRLPGVAANGTLTFSRTDTSTAQSGPAGIQVSTNNSDPTSNIFYITTQAYNFAIGQSSVQVSAVAQQIGSSGNVGTGLITNLVSQAAGVATVSNPSPFTGGADPESDDSLRKRTLAAIIPQNTVQSINNAALGIAGIVSAYTVDQQDHNGNFLVYACDTTGSLYTTEQNSVVAAVNNTKSLGTTGTVYPPTMFLQDIYYEFAIRAGWQVATVQQAINQVITNYFNSIQIGQVLRPYDIVCLVLGAIPGNPQVPGVLNFRITNPTTYLVPPNWGIYKLGTIHAQITSY